MKGVDWFMVGVVDKNRVVLKVVSDWIIFFFRVLLFKDLDGIFVNLNYCLWCDNFESWFGLF